MCFVSLMAAILEEEEDDRDDNETEKFTYTWYDDYAIIENDI